ncbi:MAG: hypothetical protein N3F11_06440 [Casimicrobiaceae bacterium]|nr:hypothetical protein [Casimicrobiaceae bacterium]
MNALCKVPQDARAIERWLKDFERFASPAGRVKLATESNVRALAELPVEIRLRRLQAIERFPALVLPMFLTVEETGSHGASAVSPEIPAEPVAQVVAAIDAAASPVPALARLYGVSKGFVRSELHRRYWHTISRSARQRLLGFIACLPNEYRPKRAEEIAEHQRRVEDYLQLVGWEAAPPRPRWWRMVHCRALPRGFGPGFARIAQLEARYGVELADASVLFDELCHVLRLTIKVDELPWRLRSFLEPDEPEPPGNGVVKHLTPEALARGWVLAHGLESIITTTVSYTEKLRRLRAGEAAFSVEQLPAVVGEFVSAAGKATELLTARALEDEGRLMQHCVRTYWEPCVRGARVFALESVEGERATALFLMQIGRDGQVFYRLSQLRGPRNAQPSARITGLAEALERDLNDPARDQARREAKALVDRPDPRTEKILAKYRVRPSFFSLPQELHARLEQACMQVRNLSTIGETHPVGLAEGT